MASSEPELILVTGGNGFVGAAIILRALKTGYHVLSAVRRQDAIDWIKDCPSFQTYHQNGSLKFMIVPDITEEGAFLTAAKGCTYIIHTASPMPLKDWGDLSVPAVRGTRAILAAAEANTSVKRVVITSSIYTLVDWDRTLPSHPDNQAAMAGNPASLPLMTGDMLAPTLAPSPAGDPPLKRYLVAKRAARNEAIQHLENKSLHFSLVHICPGYVLGPAVLSRKKSDWFSTTSSLFAFLLQPYPIGMFYGYPPEQDAPLAAWTCHIDDCADAHIKALSKKSLFPPKGPQHRDFLICSDGPHGPKWNDAIEIVKQDLPDIAKQLPLSGQLDTIPGNFDSSPVEKELLGRKLVPFTQQVRDSIMDWHTLPE